MTAVVLTAPVRAKAQPIPEMEPAIETISHPARKGDGNGAQLKPYHQPEPVIYPESDGKPMADNTKQFETVVTTQGGIAVDQADDPNVFVAGDLLWYPVEGNNHTRAAPDVMVVFGRPKGHRSSYLQWKEDDIPPQVVFEILSPGNTVIEMARKFQFYQRYGVEEYYVYDPDHGELSGYLRESGLLREIEEMEGWVSPRLKIRFSLEGDELVLYHPNGERFETFIQMEQRATRERQRAEQEHARAEQERERAEQERERAEQERERAERLAERLRALGIDPATV